MAQEILTKERIFEGLASDVLPSVGGMHQSWSVAPMD